jgi:hypothetical protein
MAIGLDSPSEDNEVLTEQQLLLKKKTLRETQQKFARDGLQTLRTRLYQSDINPTVDFSYVTLERALDRAIRGIDPKREETFEALIALRRRLANPNRNSEFFLLEGDIELADTLSTYWHPRFDSVMHHIALPLPPILEAVETRTCSYLRRKKLREAHLDIEAVFRDTQDPVIRADALNSFQIIVAETRQMEDYFNDEDQMIAAGIQGEYEIALALKNTLDGDWTYLTNYKGSTGEIDGLLIGPNGIFTIEVKNIRGTVSCVGDDWYRSHHGRGNPQSSENFMESPSKQLIRATECVQEIAGAKFENLRVGTIIVFPHKELFVWNLENLTVDVATKLEYWRIEETLNAYGTTLSREDVQFLVGQFAEHIG